MMRLLSRLEQRTDHYSVETRDEPIDHREPWHDEMDGPADGPDWLFRGVILGLLLGGAGAFLATCTEAEAHKAPTGWQYPLSCCHNKDCGEIPGKQVKETPVGFVVTVLPGQHEMVKDAPVQFIIPYGEEKLSPDGMTHICLSSSLKLLCFFTGSRGF